jgi:hypothetical protein
VATAEAHTLPLRKVGEFVRAASQADVNGLVRYNRGKEESGECDFLILDVQEAALTLKTIKTSTNKDDVEFARSWEQEHNELKTAVCRLVLAYRNRPLLASSYSKQQDTEMETDIQRAGPVVYGGDRARDMLIAVMERGETDRDSINYSIVGAVMRL